MSTKYGHSYLNKKYILLDNLGSKHSQLMKFGQFKSYYNRKKMYEKIQKNCDLRTSSRLFCVCKELNTTSVGQLNFRSKLLILDVLPKLSKFYPNQHTNLLRFLFTEDSLKIKKGLELVFRPHFSYDFLIKNFLL